MAPIRLAVDLDISPDLADDCHGDAPNKDQLVFHETISPDYPGLSDLRGVSEYLGRKGYGIHSIIDAEANLAWAVGNRRCIYWHTSSGGTKGSGDTNTRAIGIELISRIPLESTVRAYRVRAWWKRKKQLHKAALLLAWLSKQEPIPLVYSDGRSPGVTTHWSVTTTYGVPRGHVDCWPKHKGGYFPVLYLIQLAKRYRPFVRGLYLKGKP